MKNIMLLIFLLGLAAWTVSCKQDSGHQQGTATETVQAEELHSPRSSPIVKLNNGERWQANPETTQGIATMQSIMSAFPQEPNMEDFKNLHDKLMTEFSLIFERCTMTGEAHNQLHNYLLPLKELIAGLDSGDYAASGKYFEKIGLHLETYSKYFI